MLNTLFFLVILAACAAMLWWVIDKAPVPKPFKDWAQWLLLFFAAVYAAASLLGYADAPVFFHGG